MNKKPKLSKPTVCSKQTRLQLLVFLLCSLPLSGWSQESVSPTLPVKTPVAQNELPEEATYAETPGNFSTITVGNESKLTADASPLVRYMAEKNLGANRQLFNDALMALSKRNFTRYKKIAQTLENYPLYPYLDYRYLLLQPEQINSKRLANFEERYQARRLAQYLRKVRLKRLLSNNQLDQLVYEYTSAAADDEITCGYLNKMYRMGQQASVQDLAIEHWSKPKSMPKQCDYPFEQLISNNVISDDIARKRYLGARKNAKKPLANYLFRFLSANDKKNAELLERLEKNALRLNQFQDELISALSNESGEDWVTSYANAAKPYYRKSTAAAAKFLNATQKKQAKNADSIALENFLDESKDFILTREALVDLNKYPALYKELGSPQTTVALEWQARALIHKAHWRKLVRAIENFPDDLRLKERWRYWALRGTQLGSSLDAEQREALSVMAKEPGFYGFAASSALGKPFTVRPTWRELNSVTQSTVVDNPLIQRAIEFYTVDMLSHANAEWRDALKQLNKDEITEAAYVASELGWHNQAISTAAKAKIWQHYGIRFPDFHISSFSSQANRYQLPQEWLYATARQESALNPRAKSSADARGLMQLLPSTAKQTAKSLDLRYQESLLENSEYNITLGSAYLSRMYFRYRNKALASAAYNAGPHRVDKWLKTLEQEIPLDAWIETIRFNETRQYVQNVLSFGLIKKALNLNEGSYGATTAGLANFSFMHGSESLVKPHAKQINKNFVF